MQPSCSIAHIGVICQGKHSPLFLPQKEYNSAHMTNPMEMNPLNNSEQKKTEPVISFLTQEQASKKASEIKTKIDFLNSIKNKVNNEEALSEEELAESQKLFGDKKFEKGRISWDISFLEHEHYQTATAGTEGSSFVEIGFPHEGGYKETEFGAQMRSKQEEIKKIYHEVGTIIDRESEKIAAEHNQNNPTDRIGWSTEAPHARRWFSVSINDNQDDKSLNLTYGGTQYNVYKNRDGFWKCAIKDSGAGPAPASVLGRFKKVENSLAQMIEQRATQIFK